jgi:hypothetical protein
VTFYESNAEVRPTGQEPAEYAEIPDPPPPPPPRDPTDDAAPAAEPAIDRPEPVVGTAKAPTRSPLVVAMVLAALGFVLVAIRFVRSRRS